MDDICNLLFPTLEKEERLRLGALCFEYENKHLETRPGTLYPGVRETFERLSKKTRLYIVSNCQCGYIQIFLACTGLSPLFQGHLCFGDTGTSKGKTIRRLMSEHGLTDACKEADVPFVFAEYGFGTVKEADNTIQAFSDLLSLFPADSL